MNNEKLTRRINKLLENKNIDFKRKYFLLSTISNFKTNKKIISEVDCFISTLINTNGSLPKEKHIENLIKEAAIQSKIKRYSSRITSIINLNNLINSKKESLAESSILEELDLSLNISSYKIDKKLKEVLIESINRNIGLFINESKSEKIKDASEFLNDYIDGEKIDVPQHDNIDVPQHDDEEDLDTSNLKSQEKRVLLDYDWLLKKEKIPFIRNKLNFYLPVGKDADYIGPNLEKIPNVDKLAIISLYQLIVEQNATNAAMRKWNIIHKIRFYLNIQQRFMDSEIVAMGEKSLRGNKSRFTSSPSGLNSDQKRSVKSELNKIITKINTSNMSSLNSSEISESALIKLLNDAAGSQSKNVKDFIDYLNSVYPDSTTSKQSEEVLSDEEYEQYILDNQAFDEKMRIEDEETFGNSPIDPETGEPLYADIETAERITKLYKEPPSQLEELEMSAKEASALFRQNTNDVNLVEKLVKKLKREKLTPEEKKSLYNAAQRLSDSKGVKITILPDKTKGEVHRELLSAIDVMDGINSIDPNTGRIISKKWEKLIQDIDTENPMSSADIARVSQGEYSGTSGVRQDINKQWKKAMFFSTDTEVKAEIHAELGKRYIDSIRSMGLIEDSILNLPGMNSASGNDETNFHKIESLLTDKTALKEYFFGSPHMDDEDYDMLDELHGGLTSYRIFATWHLKDFYSNHVWNKIESKLAYAIKEYFKKYHPEGRIGENLKPGRKSRDVKPEFGKNIFNKIIYVVMERTGIKDKGTVIPNPKLEIEERKKHLRKVATSSISQFNAGSQPNKINNFNVENLVKDCFDEISNSIIGSVWSAQSVMSSEDQSNFFEYLKSKKAKDFELRFVESALSREYCEGTLNNPLSPLGNPAELSAISKGKDSKEITDKGKPESAKGAPYWYRLLKQTTSAEDKKDLRNYTDTSAAAREKAISAAKDYSFLEDSELNKKGWQVIYKGQPAEVKDSVDIESGKLEIIVDILNSNGDIIDGEEVEVSIDDVLPVK